MRAITNDRSDQDTGKDRIAGAVKETKGAIKEDGRQGRR
jgi:hypothetical protein